MMRNIFLLLLLIGTIFACDDNVSDAELEGSWNLTNYSAFSPELPTLNEGDVIWTFDDTNSTLIIENNVDALYPYFEDSGTYNYTISNGLIEVDGIGDYSYNITDDVLRLDSNTDPEISADGPMLRFEKE